MIGLIARKEGMSRVFTDEGKSVPVTVLKIHSNVVSQIKTSEKDGYDAIQISAVEQSEKNQSKAEIGHLKKNNISFKKLSQEFSLNLSEEENLDIGSEIKADIFEEGQFVDVIGTTKGKVLRVQLKGGILQLKMLLTETLLPIENLVLLDNAKLPEEFGKEKKCQDTWVT